MSRLLFVLLICPTLAMAQQIQLPNDVDLKAAYCIPIARWATEIPVGEKLPEPFRKSIQDTKEKGAANLRRLRLYLHPRVSYLDTLSLIGAAKSAEDDMAQTRAEVDNCGRMNTTEDAMKCLSVETEAVKRIRSCDVLSFLPF